MITEGFPYVAVLLASAGGLLALQHATASRFFDYVPPIVLLYFGVMVLASVGLWSRTPSIDETYYALRNNLLPAMIFLLLLKSDLRQIARMGPRMPIGFSAAALSIMLGFVVAFALFHTLLEAGAWKTFAALAGSWMGGTGNMAAIQGALNVPDSSMGYTLLIDSIDYAIWVVILLALVPMAPAFNRWTKATADELLRIGGELEAQHETTTAIGSWQLVFLTGLALAVSALTQQLAGDLPTTDFLTRTTWIVLFATAAGVLGALTPLSRMAGSAEIGAVMLYLIIALIASRANFAELTQAPVYIVAGFVILLVHGVVMVAVAKLLRLDLFTCGVASLANIGGVASAPILAASYSRALIPVGVLMAMLGYIVGTAGGLIVGKMLSVIAA